MAPLWEVWAEAIVVWPTFRSPPLSLVLTVTTLVPLLFNDLLTFMANAILKSGKEIFGMWKPSKFNVPQWNELAKGLNVRHREAVSHWNIAGRPWSGPLSQLKCSVGAAFRNELIFLRENEDQLRFQSMLSKVQRGECNDLWKEIKSLNPKKEFQPLTVGGTPGKSNISNLWKDNFSAIANSVGFTDNRDQVFEQRQIVRGEKNKKAGVNDGIPSNVY